MSTHNDNSINANFASRVKEVAAEILERFGEWGELENQPLVAYLRSGEYDKVAMEFLTLELMDVHEDDDSDLADRFFLTWEAGFNPEELAQKLEHLYRTYRWPEVVLELSDEWNRLVIVKETVDGLEWPSDGVSAD